MTAAQQPIGVLVALREELRAIEPVLRGRNVAIARTGIGKTNAREKAAAFLAEKKPALLIVSGFAGGLRPGLKAGDVVIAAEVNEEGRASYPWTAPGDLLARARVITIAGGTVHTGRLVTVERVMTSALERSRLREATGADAVDMESSAVLAVAASRGIPAVCARAILDEHDFELPFDFGKILTPDGRPRLVRAVSAVVANPAGLAKLLPLRARAKAAAQSLAELISKVVEALA